MLVFSTGLLLLSVLFHGVCSLELKEGENQDITCKLSESGQTVWWFRLVKNTQLQFIASFNMAGDLKNKETNINFDSQKMKSSQTLTLKGFEKEKDSGSYSCASINNNKLHFGSVTNLQGTPEPKPEIKVVPTTRATLRSLTTKAPVACEKSPDHGRGSKTISLGCELIILIPLAAGCGLLLMLLIITTIYCNSIRTRRCPHHYKRHPRNNPAGHRPLPHHPEF